MTQIINTTSVAAGNSVTTAGSELVYIAQGTLRASTDSLGIFSSGASPEIIIAGEILGVTAGLSVLNLGGDTVGSAVTVTATGSVAGTTGVSLSDNTHSLINDGTIAGSDSGVANSGTLVEILNSGSISGADGPAISNFGDGARINNTGSISSSGIYGIQNYQADNSTINNSGTIASSGADAVYNFQGDVFQVMNEGVLSSSAGAGFRSIESNLTILNNSGTISGVFPAVRADDVDLFSLQNSGTIISSFSLGVFNDGGTNFELSNTGEITSMFSGAVVANTVFSNVTNDGIIQSLSLNPDDWALEATTSGDFDIVNRGTISSASGSAIKGDDAGFDFLENHGTIFGDIDFAGNDDTIVNLATISGNILLGDGVDQLFNDGSVFGDIDLGVGADIYDGMSSGEVAGRVNGGADSDSLFGSSADDDLRGDNQSDLIEGNSGDDDLLGGQGQDVIRGGDGNDRLFGQSNGDSLNGGAGLDRLSGGLANDTFVFEIGNDVDIIDDFANNGIEKIDLRDFASADAMAAIANAYQVSFQVRIDFGDGDMLAINGITVADLDNSDFIFA